MEASSNIMNTPSPQQQTQQQQQRNQIVIIRRGTMLHAHMVTTSTCYCLGPSRWCARRYQIFTTWRGCPLIVAAIMSFSYSFIGYGLGLAKVIENGTIKVSVSGVAVATTAEKVWKITQVLGDIAFTYPFSIILLEFEDTLKSPPPENQTMKKASMALKDLTNQAGEYRFMHSNFPIVSSS